MQLDPSDIKTKEVFNWKGYHLLHFYGSACSQKLRIFLSLKKIKWKSHQINLQKQEQFDDWFLGINPRGLVPTLVYNGNVYIESNDIMFFIESINTNINLIPNKYIKEIEENLAYEDSLHHDLRILTFRFIVPHFLGKKNLKKLNNKKNNKGTIKGEIDIKKDKEVDFWMNHHKFGITDEQVNESFKKFSEAVTKIELKLTKNSYILNNEITVLDIAWFININRIVKAGFDLKNKYPNTNKWYKKLKSNKNFSKEVKEDLPIKIIVNMFRLYNFFTGNLLRNIVR
ncbi:MAG: glutathione S-transferase [Gammaproteobacteria bacterium]|nr:MAG: glutathione S-transferase [Gammaproteobacteria bacterium]